jgi:hypothetical protein
VHIGLVGGHPGVTDLIGEIQGLAEGLSGSDADRLIENNPVADNGRGKTVVIAEGQIGPLGAAHDGQTAHRASGGGYLAGFVCVGHVKMWRI